MIKVASIMDGLFINKLNSQDSKVKSDKLTWHPLEHKIWKEIHQNIPKNGFAKILLGISGGVDSMAMVEIFRVLQKALKFDLIVCHIHHGDINVSNETLIFRQQSLDCVEKYCLHYQLPFILKKK